MSLLTQVRVKVKLARGSKRRSRLELLLETLCKQPWRLQRQRSDTKDSMSGARLKPQITLSNGLIAVQRKSVKKCSVIHWIEIYPVDSTIQPLNSPGLNNRLVRAFEKFVLC